MKAQDLQFTALIQGAKQFIIPIYQRTYSWDIENCEQLWDDIIRVGEDASAEGHFIGSAVYIPEQETSAAISRWLVIDGQQRITTMTLLFLALMHRLQDEDADTIVSAEEIEDYYLKNRHGKGDLKYKVMLTKADKATLIALLENKTPPEPVSQRIVNNFDFFTEKISTADLGVLYEGIQKLKIVDVSLQQGIDDPQMIFESMNSTGKALTQADLIRNFVLMRHPHAKQTKLYEDYWRPMEELFGAENFNKHFDECMRFFLVIRTGDYRIRKDQVYDEFKAYSRNYSVEELLEFLKEYSHLYCCIALGKETDPKLQNLFKDIRELRAEPCYPLLMQVYRDYSTEIIGKEEFITTIQLVESYVFRRAICDIPTNSLRQTFATLHSKFKSDQYMESIHAAFLLLPSYRRFPSDEEFSEKLKSRNLYRFNKRSYWLRRFENFGRKERVSPNEYTIEHIMPQKDPMSEAWQAELGEEWERIHKQYLHTLGNLTLTGYNSEYSNRPFSEKQNMKGGFKDSPLKVNTLLRSCQGWNETAILDRADGLSKEALRIWAAPYIDADTLDNYREIKPAHVTHYGIDDHPHLRDGITRELFEAFREAVLALEPCVREEILKRYIAYKAETNFVDVVPQSKRLRMTLNMEFPQVDDPRGICEDVTNVGRWGNGNVHVVLEKIDDLPYVIGIVRQSLEIQLGEEAVAH